VGDALSEAAVRRHLLRKRMLIAGVRFGRIRGLLTGLAAPAILCIIVSSIALSSIRHPSWQEALAIVVALVAVLVLMASLFTLPAAAWYRHRRRREFRRDLARLRPEERLVVLRGVWQEGCPQTRSVVEPLIREFWPKGKEIAPASTPAGGGSEVAGSTPDGDPEK
jgi:uncharacterized membrane protein YbhN (UPF0104 family)